MSNKQAGLGSRILELLSGSRGRSLDAVAKKLDADRWDALSKFDAEPYGLARRSWDDVVEAERAYTEGYSAAESAAANEKLKVLATRLGLGGTAAGAGVGAGITHHVKESSAQEVPQAYVEGFIAKCAEYNVDPQEITKVAAAMWPGSRTQALLDLLKVQDATILQSRPGSWSYGSDVRKAFQPDANQMQRDNIAKVVRNLRNRTSVVDAKYPSLRELINRADELVPPNNPLKWPPPPPTHAELMELANKRFKFNKEQMPQGKRVARKVERRPKPRTSFMDHW